MMLTSFVLRFQFFVLFLIIPSLATNSENLDFIERASYLQEDENVQLNISRGIVHILARMEALEKELCDKKVEVAQLKEQLHSFNTIKQLEHDNLQLELKLIKNMESKCEKLDATLENQQTIVTALQDNINRSIEQTKQNQEKESDVLTHCRQRGNKLELTKLATGIYYFSGTNRLNWFQAFKLCGQNGLELASVESAEEHNALISEIKRREKEGIAIWISGSDQGSEGKFYWASTGKGMTYTEWHTSEPTNSGGSEHCVHLWDVKGAFKWNDKACMTVYPFICKVPQFCVPLLQ